MKNNNLHSNNFNRRVCFKITPLHLWEEGTIKDYDEETDEFCILIGKGIMFRQKWWISRKNINFLP